jgi:hypothetical protein
MMNLRYNLDTAVSPVLALDIPITFPALWRIARKFLIDFPSSYYAKKDSSTIVNLLIKKKK